MYPITLRMCDVCRAQVLSVPVQQFDDAASGLVPGRFGMAVLLADTLRILRVEPLLQLGRRHVHRLLELRDRLAPACVLVTGACLF